MKIERIAIDDLEVQKISDGITSYNQQMGMPPRKDSQSFAFIARDSAENFLGGAKGYLRPKGWCHLSWLYSTQNVKGIGTRLMNEVEAFAQDRNCKGVTLDTLQNQAPIFYTKIGFEIFGEIPDFDQGQRRIYMMKRF